MGRVESVARPRGLRPWLASLTPAGRPLVPIGWALYDFANTIFSFAIVSGAMGLWVNDDARFGERDGAIVLSAAIVVSVGVNALVSPVLGALSDRGGRRLPFLAFFTALCVVPTALIGGSPPLLGVVLFVVANFAYQAALIYYDATLRTVSLPSTRGTLSGLGVGIGYCGTIVSGAILIGGGFSVEQRFPIAALLFGLFAVPIFLVVRETGAARPVVRLADVTQAFLRLRRTVVDAAATPGLGRFLVARFFYTDAVNTIIVVMSVVSVEAMGLTATEALGVLLSLTIVAIVVSVAWGRAVDRFGPRRTLMVVLVSWAVGLVLGAVSLGVPGPPGMAMFLVAGGLLGSGLGGVQIADRVLLVRLAPPERLGEFFGLYGLVGKGSQIVGLILYAAVIGAFVETLGTGAYQLAVISLLVTMAIGAWILRPVRDGWDASSGGVAPAPAPSAE